MLDLMVLYVIFEYELSMYLILKRIHDTFGNFSKPSFGALKPALTKLEKSGFIKSRKSFSDGGKLTVYYQITTDGKKALKTMITDEISSNPVQFKSNAAIKVIISQILPPDIQHNVLETLYRQMDLLKIDAEKILQSNNNMTPYQKLVTDNLIVEYNNFLKIIENLKK